MTNTTDNELERVLAHNRDEEVEHACMLIEWLRKQMPVFDRELSSQLFAGAPEEQLEKMAGDTMAPGTPAKPIGA